MDGVKAWLEQTTSGRFAALGAVGVIAPLAGTAIATGAGDVILVVLAGLIGAAWSWGQWYRKAVGRLPIELSPVALTGRIDGVPVYRFRFRLGRGRRMEAPKIALSFHRTDGQEITLEPVVPVQTLVGPCTVTAPDPQDACAGPGTFTLRIEVREGKTTWQQQASWERNAVQEGRFAAGMSRIRGRLRWDHVGWERPRPTDPDAPRPG